jgi:hypothetical protein
MTNIPLFRGTAAHFALQGIDYRGMARVADDEREAGRAKAWSNESLRSSRTAHARQRLTDRLNRRTFAERNAALVTATGGAR